MVWILEFNEELNHIVYYGVDPTEVRQQTGEFGTTFEGACAGSSENLSRNWSQAFDDVASYAGHRSTDWPNDVAMVEAIESDISSRLRKLEIEPRRFILLTILVVMNLVTEIVSAVSDQLSSKRKPYFTRISLAMSILSVVFSIIDLSYKIREEKARFRCKWPIPWFYYPSRGYRRIFGSYTDTVLLFCVFGSLIVSTINYRFVATGRDGPIKTSIWPLFFAIGMVVSKFLEKSSSSYTADLKPYDSMV